MRKIIVQEWISLDGFAADRDGSTKFFEDPKYNEGLNDEMLKIFDTVDATLLGAKTYKLFSEFWPTADPEQEPITPRLNALPKIVFSKTLKEANWGPATIRRDDVADAVRELRQQEGKNLIMWGSLSLVQRLAEEGLVDEYWITIVPSFIGEGRKFIPENVEITDMELMESKALPTGILYLKYRPKSRNK